ncbi:hypothetical protein [Vaginisenegalia massiliensis]|uniref:hypothetical protein n=1 Tax=Vaginisenegalia massiliensis TaxID=2058294 RepID=UPI000F51FDB6|nr:hypothetical protein [Vaginisenegalia massiliensis]
MKDVTESIKEGQKAWQGFWRQYQKGNFNKSKGIGLGRGPLYLILVLLVGLYYYLVLPPLHYASAECWQFLALILVGVIIIEGLHGFGGIKNAGLGRVRRFNSRLWLGSIIFLVVGLFLAYLCLSPLFIAKSYADMIHVDKADFSHDFPQTDINQIPLIDRDTASRLGNRKIGALSNLVSQFEAQEDYTQINIKNHPYRVTPFAYAGFFKWLNNFGQGIPYYLKVDMVSGKVTVEKPESPLKYSLSDKFDRNVMRVLRFHFPFALLGKPSFEVDDQGNPYYVTATYGRHFFIWEPEVTGIVALNAMTGQTKYYKKGEVPKWVDRVYSSDLILHQLEMHGRYQQGFWNSLFAKEGVTKPTEGYSYIPMKDDIYLYTGLTSVNSDQSNIGFVLVNMRTKQTTFYPVTAAEEFSAMSSAEGSVQEKGYKATFPLLISLEGKPMYILSLKDASGLIKAYALVDVQNYQTVYIESSVNRLLLKYAQDNPLDVKQLELKGQLKELKGAVQSIQATVVDGNTVYYFMMDGKIYRANIKLSDQLPFIKEGDQVQFKADSKGQVEVFQLVP